ncbi:MAG: hypothetical protein COU51_02640 [Parcubacteria group bacterium CG10_big_fil_rev_8_21_14_0_10_36_14]|nr:MAG: hypothetical protein COU51_02640 [Parcubacteria group bacterium CG10_big_fil_rev_8_21_14_0_10_36_14]
MRTDTTKDVQSLLEENIKLSKAILHSTEKTRKAMQWMKIMSLLRVIIIIIPIIIALIYVPPFLSQFSKTFGSFYGGEQFNILQQLQNFSGDTLGNILQ